MKAIILAGGEGKRMRPLTYEKPKPMLEILGKPIIQHIWDILPEKVTEVILVVGYKADMFKNFLGDEYEGKKIHYVTQEKQLGNGHAVYLCRELINPGEKFLVLFGDDLHDKESIARCAEKECAVLVTTVRDPRRFGTVITDAQNKVLEIEEKPEHPKTNRINVGVYVLDDRIFKYRPQTMVKGEYFLTSMVESFMKDHDIYAVETNFWHPVGYPEDLKTAEQALLKRTARTPQAV